MKSNVDLARGLVAKAENDLRIAEIGWEHGAPLDTVCFHCQQAAEKLLKALLTARNLDYPRTHDVLALLDLAVRQWPELAEFRESLLAFSSYAVGMRYDAGIYPDRSETLRAQASGRQAIPVGDSPPTAAGGAPVSIPFFVTTVPLVE